MVINQICKNKKCMTSNIIKAHHAKVFNFLRKIYSAFVLLNRQNVRYIKQALGYAFVHFYSLA